MSHPNRDSGFTMIELLVTLSLLGIMMAIAISGWSSWAKASAQSGTARELQSVLRQAHQRAVTEGTSMCAAFDVADDTYTVYRGACGGVAVLGPFHTDAAAVHLALPSFDDAGTPVTGVTMHARGTATPGSVIVTRDGSSKQYTVTVERLTGRVSLD